MSPVCKMADNGRLTVDQKVKVVLFYAETKKCSSDWETFLAHFGTSWAPCKQTIYRLSLGTISSVWGLSPYQKSNAFVKIKSVMFTISGVTFRAPYCIFQNDKLSNNITLLRFFELLRAIKERWNERYGSVSATFKLTESKEEIKYRSVSWIYCIL